MNKRARLERRSVWYAFGIVSVSPLFWIIANSLIALLVALLPPGWIADTLHEPNVVFLNPNYMAFVTLAFIAFFLGIFCPALLTGKTAITVSRPSPRLSPTKQLIKRLLILYGLCLLIELAEIALIFSKVGVSVLVAALHDPAIANSVHLNIAASMRVFGINVMAFQYLVFASSMIGLLVILLSPKTRSIRYLRLLYGSVAGAYILIGLITFSRWPVMQYLAAMLAVYLLSKNVHKGLSLRKLLPLAVGIALSGTAIFLAYSVMRMGANHAFTSVIGYFLGPYNLGAATIDGTFRQPYAGTTYAVLGMLWNAPVFGGHLRLAGGMLGLNLPVTHVVDMDTIVALWTLEANRAGFNGTYLWNSIYGYLFGDIGWFALGVFFAYGALSWLVYAGFMRMRILSVILYPYIFVSLITWFTSAFISNTPLDDYLIFSLIISAYLGRQWRLSLRQGAIPA